VHELPSELDPSLDRGRSKAEQTHPFLPIHACPCLQVLPL
jgi:hypothetical protein